jgi:ribosomal protein L11 methyltransferase
LVLKGLADNMVAGYSVADIGTGVGILAVAAKKLGAGYVFASDIYPPVEAAAKRLFEANGVEVEFSTSTWPKSNVDLVICSIGDPFVNEHRDKLISCGNKVVVTTDDMKVEVIHG